MGLSLTLRRMAAAGRLLSIGLMCVEAFQQLDQPTTPFGRSLPYLLTAFD